MPRKPKDPQFAVNRKDQILDAAAALFANIGFYKTTTAMVAAEVGVTQPYVFHFFKTKESLYLAVLERAMDRLVEAFTSVEAPAQQLAHRMGMAFNELALTHRDEILLCMQAFTTPEPQVREFVRGQFARIQRILIDRFRQAGLPQPQREASMFIATGLLITLTEVLQMPELLPCEEV